MRTGEGISPEVSQGNVIASLLGFFGMYGVLSLLFLFLIYFEVQRGPGAEPQGAAAPIPTPARQQH
jgi:cytochrome d ubiquinol oxidase subunit I